MQTENLRKAIEEGVNTALKNLEVNRVKGRFDEAIEDGLATTRQAIKRGRRNAEEMIETASVSVREHPMRAAGVMLGVGVGLGVILGLFAVRNGRG